LSRRPADKSSRYCAIEILDDPVPFAETVRPDSGNALENARVVRQVEIVAIVTVQRIEVRTGEHNARTSA
jgi:hypothetical protein